MAKYLFEASYTNVGAKGLMSEGGSSRRQQIQSMLGTMGGKLEAMYYAFGDNDVYAIVDVPDNVTAVAVSMAVNASGAVTAKIIVLITPEELDEASKKSVSYRPPGS